MPIVERVIYCQECIPEESGTLSDDDMREMVTRYAAISLALCNPQDKCAFADSMLPGISTAAFLRSNNYNMNAVKVDHRRNERKSFSNGQKSRTRN